MRHVHSSKCSSGSTGSLRGSKGVWRYAVWSARLWGRWGACFATQKRGSFGPSYLDNRIETCNDTHILREIVKLATRCMSYVVHQMHEWGVRAPDRELCAPAHKGWNSTPYIKLHTHLLLAWMHLRLLANVTQLNFRGVGGRWDPSKHIHLLPLKWTNVVKPTNHHLHTQTHLPNQGRVWVWESVQNGQTLRQFKCKGAAPTKGGVVEGAHPLLWVSLTVFVPQTWTLAFGLFVYI